MAKTLHLNRRGDMLIAADNEGLDALRELPEGKRLKAQVVVPRNEAFHRLVFSMLKMTFDMWEPDTLVTEVEKATVIRLTDYMISRGVSEEACCQLATEFLQALNAKRCTLDIDKSFEAFRAFVTVKAGFYREVMTPAGPRREPVSWSFASMDEATFRELYRAVFGVCWQIALSQHFSDEEAAENAINALVGYAP